MELTEALRRILSRRWLIVLALVAVAVGGTIAMTVVAEPLYASTARMEATSTPPGSDTEADSILDQVLGVATSPSIVSRALHDAHVRGHPSLRDVSGDVQVDRIGTSAVFEVTVQYPDRAEARALAKSVTQETIAYLNGSASAGTSRLEARLRQQRDQLVAQRQQRYEQMAGSTPSGQRARLAAEIGSLDQDISDANSAIHQLGLTVATSSNASLVSPAGAATPVAPHLASHLALAVIAGALTALLLCILLETARPRIADARALARELHAPFLGEVHGQLVDVATALALRGSARRMEVSTVLLGGVASTGVPALAGQLRSVLATPVPLPPIEAVGTGAMNGHGGHSMQDRGSVGAAGAHGGSKTRTRPATRTTATVTDNGAPPPPPDTLDVITLSDLGSTLRTGCGLVIVTPPLTRLREVYKITDLGAATGWPVLGVLDDRTSSPRKGS